MCGIRNLRVLFGPLPLIICQAHFKLTQAMITFAIAIIIMVTLTRFVIICIWGSMRPIKDDFFKRFAISQSFMMCALHTWCWPTANLDVSVKQLFIFLVFVHTYRYSQIIIEIQYSSSRCQIKEWNKF